MGRSRAWWSVATGLVVGGAFGLLFGMAALNRPGANALVFYVLCALAGAVVAALLHALPLLLRLRSRGGSRSPGR